MSSVQRIGNIVLAVLILLFALILITIPEEGLPIIILILATTLVVRGFRLLWYYFSMARHMVGGKSTLYRAIIILDLGIFTSSLASMSSYAILLYLVGIYAFSGIIDILRAFEAKRFGAPLWRARRRVRQRRLCRSAGGRQHPDGRQHHPGIRLQRQPGNLRCGQVHRRLRQDVCRLYPVKNSKSFSP